MRVDLAVVVGLLIAGVCVFVAGWITHREVALYRRVNRTVGRPRNESIRWPPW